MEDHPFVAQRSKIAFDGAQGDFLLQIILNEFRGAAGVFRNSAKISSFVKVRKPFYPT
jgi:hypothetical protein